MLRDTNDRYGRHCFLIVHTREGEGVRALPTSDGGIAMFETDYDDRYQPRHASS